MVPCRCCGCSYDVTLFQFGRTIWVTCGEQVALTGRRSSAQAPSELRFFADAMLGRIARWLRIAGYDTRYDPHVQDADLVRIALDEGSFVLTRGPRAAAGVVGTTCAMDGSAQYPNGTHAGRARDRGPPRTAIAYPIGARSWLRILCVSARSAGESSTGYGGCIGSRCRHSSGRRPSSSAARARASASPY